MSCLLYTMIVAVVGLEKTFFNVSEDVGTVELCAIVYEPNVTFNCPIDFPFNVSLTTSDDTAGKQSVVSNEIVIICSSMLSVALFDYGPLNKSLLLFAACQRRSCVNVTIINDEQVENDELFNVTLERTPGLDDRITLNPINGVIQINDDDGL